MAIAQVNYERIVGLGLPVREGNHSKKLYSFQGDNVRVPAAFFVDVVDSKKNDGIIVDTNDVFALEQLIEGIPLIPDQVERELFIDDAGTTYPLGGMVCGVYDSKTRQLATAIVDVRFFRGRRLANMRYVKEYGEKAVGLVEGMGVDKEKTLIRICSGYVNEEAKQYLRDLGYFVVTDKIEGDSQNLVEDAFSLYLQFAFGFGDYVDPKVLGKDKIGRHKRMVLRWAKEREIMGWCKQEKKWLERRKRSKRR